MLRLLIRRLFSRIRNKIILPYLLLALCLAITMTFLTVRLTTGAVQERLNNRLVEAGQATSDSLVAVEDQQIEQLRSMVFTIGVADAVDVGDRESLETLLRPYWASLDLAALAVFDERGAPLLAWQRDPAAAPGSPPAQAATAGLETSWLVQQIVAGREDEFGDKFSAFRDRFFYTVAPVRRGGRLAGGMMVGLPTDTLLERLQARSQASITTFYDGSGRAFATTQILVSGEVVPAVPPEALAGLHTARESAAPTHIQSVATLNGRDYQFAYSPLRVRRTVDGFFSVALSRGFILDTWAQQRLPLMLLALGMVLAVIVLGLVLSRQITRPLHDLVVTAHAVARGELRRRSGVESQDELGVVSRAFNQMTERLLHLYEASRAISAQTQIEAILGQVTAALRPLTPGAHAAALLEDARGWRCHIAADAPVPLLALHHRRLSDPPPTDCLLRASGPLVLPADHPLLRPLGLPESVAEVGCVALMVQERLIGVLLVLADRAGLFSEAVMEPLAAVASMAATSLHNTRLYLEIQTEGNRRRAILESIADGVVVCDADRYVALMNPAAEALLKLPDWSSRRYHFSELPLTPLAELALRTGERALHPRYEVYGQVVQASSAVLSSQDEALSGEVIVLHNISEEVALDQAKTSLIALISHELRTPLTTMTGVADMLAKEIGGPLTEVQKELAHMALRQSQAMGALIDKAILVANIEAGALECDLKPIHLRSVVETAIGPLRSAAQEAGVTLRLSIPDSLPLVVADTRLLAIALQQLLENAISYAADAPVRVVARTYRDGVALGIRDYGPGIPAEDLPQIFRRLHRGAGSLNAAPRGMGLGLVITRELIERQGGTISVESQPGEGTLFNIFFPGAEYESQPLVA